VPFHHDPAHDDDMLDTFLGARADEPFTVLPAREGMTFDVAELARV
jgi:hypothetical protein